MDYIKRSIESFIHHELKRGKSILLLGPRQTGKTTLIEECIKPDACFSFANLQDYLRYASSPTLLLNEWDTLIEESNEKPLIFIDEIQKIPLFMDAAQHYIDKNKAQFILSGSSARKLKHGPSVNLLPGRATAMRMSPFHYAEITNNNKPSIEDLLLYGTLPRVLDADEKMDKEAELQSYVNTYLQDEIQAEGVVKKLGSFAKFLQLASGESGKTVNFLRLSQDVGIASSTIQNYYQILDDCMMVHRIDPITKTTTKRRLINAPRYLFFDLGVKRVAAGEGYSLSPRHLGERFEQWVGIELINLIHSTPYFYKLCYWRDSAGPEVDYVLDTRDQWIPIEVKYKANPSIKDARHLLKFMQDYTIDTGYIICSVHKRIVIHQNPRIIALPWQDLASFIAKTHTT